MAGLSLRNVKKIYDNTVVAVQEFNLEIADKEFIVLVGPSGCGKSTTLRMVAGLEDITEGEIYIGGRKVNTVPPKDRDIAMVFQNYALYPHMTVYKNIAFGLIQKKVPKDEIDKRVHEAAKALDLEHLLNRKPKALSGGQRQKVYFAMALAQDTPLVLLDEPATYLDLGHQLELMERISLLRSRGKTVVAVLHDLPQALEWAGHIVVMKEGRLAGEGSPEEIFRQGILDQVFGLTCRRLTVDGQERYFFTKGKGEGGSA